MASQGSTLANSPGAITSTTDGHANSVPMESVRPQATPKELRSSYERLLVDEHARA